MNYPSILENVLNKLKKNVEDKKFGKYLKRINDSLPKKKDFLLSDKDLEEIQGNHEYLSVLLICLFNISKFQDIILKTKFEKKNAPISYMVKRIYETKFKEESKIKKLISSRNKQNMLGKFKKIIFI